MAVEGMGGGPDGGTVFSSDLPRDAESGCFLALGVTAEEAFFVVL